MDLIHRAMYYISLDDKYLQQALSDLKTPNPTIKTYFDETVAAESRRKCFQDIAQSSTCLDSKGVNISKWDAPFPHKKKFNTKSETKTVASSSVKLKSDASDSTQGKDSKGGIKAKNKTFLIKNLNSKIKIPTKQNLNLTLKELGGVITVKLSHMILTFVGQSLNLKTKLLRN